MLKDPPVREGQSESKNIRISGDAGAVCLGCHTSFLETIMISINGLDLVMEGSAFDVSLYLPRAFRGGVLGISKRSKIAFRLARLMGYSIGRRV